MALLPAENLLNGTKTPTTTTSEMRGALGALRRFLADLLGTDSADKAAARTALGVPSAVDVQSGVDKFAVAAGTADAMTAIMVPPVEELIDGMEIRMRFLGPNTVTAPTLKIDELPPVTITAADGAALSAGAYLDKWPATFRYRKSAAKFELLNPLVNSRIGEIVDWPFPSAKQNGLLCNGAAVPSATYAALFSWAVKKLAGATITIASPAVVTWALHPLYVNAPIKFTTTSALPTGLVAGTTYYVIAAGFTANTFQLSATIGGAAIITSGVQSGVHTAIHAPYGCANDLSAFNVPNIPADYTTVQATSNEGTATVGVVISHNHSGIIASQLNGSVTTTGGIIGLQSNGADIAIGFTGGTSNLAAGIRVRKYIMFA